MRGEIHSRKGTRFFDSQATKRQSTGCTTVARQYVQDEVGARTSFGPICVGCVGRANSLPRPRAGRAGSQPREFGRCVALPNVGQRRLDLRAQCGRHRQAAPCAAAAGVRRAIRGCVVPDATSRAVVHSNCIASQPGHSRGAANPPNSTACPPNSAAGRRDSIAGHLAPSRRRTDPRSPSCRGTAAEGSATANSQRQRAAVPALGLQIGSRAAADGIAG